MSGTIRCFVVVLILAGLAACGTSPPPQSVEVPPDPREVVQVQSALLALGFAPGPVDGVLGPRTEKAIAAYQGTYDLPITGRIDERLTESLFGRSGALSFVANAGLPEVRYLEPPFPSGMRGFLERRYGADTARRRPFEAGSWLDVSQASLGTAPGEDQALIVSLWSSDNRQTSELSIFRPTGTSYREVLGPLPNQGYEFVDSFSNGLRDVAVTQGSGYRLLRFDGASYR